MINLRKIVLVLVLIVSGLSASRMEHDDIYTTYKAGKYKKALADFRILAEDKSDNDAAYTLRFMYEHGEGCKIDKEESIKCIINLLQVTIKKTNKV